LGEGAKGKGREGQRKRKIAVAISLPFLVSLQSSSDDKALSLFLLLVHCMHLQSNFDCLSCIESDRENSQMMCYLNLVYLRIAAAALID